MLFYVISLSSCLLIAAVLSLKIGSSLGKLICTRLEEIFTKMILTVKVKHTQSTRWCQITWPSEPLRIAEMVGGVQILQNGPLPIS
jgi:hypothetical protein